MLPLESKRTKIQTNLTLKIKKGQLFRIDQFFHVNSQWFL